MEVLGLKKLMAAMDKLKVKSVDKKPTVIVGFTQRYALWVHEDPDANHPVGQWKYLEQPSRKLTNTGVLQAIIIKVYKQTKDIWRALLMAGLRLQREAQKMTPVDTSALKSSAYTCKEGDHDKVAEAAFAKSEAARQSKIQSGRDRFGRYKPGHKLSKGKK